MLVTGGLPGPPQLVARAFAANSEFSGQVIHLLPRLNVAPKFGRTLRCGWTMKTRRKMLAQYCDCYVSLEGGSGTRHEIDMVRTRGAMLLPIGRFGGCSERLYRDMPCPAGLNEHQWRILGDPSATVSEVADAVSLLFRRLMITFSH